MLSGKIFPISANVRELIFNRSYVRERRGPLLQQCEKNIEEIQEQINDFVVAVENMRVTISKIEKEINEGGASVARIRDNIRVRKLIQEIARIQAEMESYDLEEAAKSKRNFQEKYNVEKQRETDLQGKVRLNEF
jgi:DNA repair protein RAD50